MSYSGKTCTIPLGQIGLFTDVPPGEVPRGALVKANDVSFETGAITKAPGSLRYNTQVLPSAIVAVHDWWPDVVTQRLIALCENGSLYRDIGDRVFSGAVAINSGLMSCGPRSSFVEGGAETALRPKKLFLFTGTNQVQVLEGDGSAFAEIEEPATDWATPNFPLFGFVHRNRLWAFMGNRAYASPTGDHEDFTGGTILTQAIYPGEGGDLVGGWIFKGRPFVFKDGGFVYYLDDSDPDSDNWTWRKIASNFGLASPHSVFETTNDMIALNESGGLISYSAVNTYGGVDSADMWKLLQISDFIRTNTSLSGVSQTHAIYYEDKKQIFITGRDSYRTHNNLLIHIDLNRQQPRAALWKKDTADCLSFRRDINKVKRPIYGAADGYVYLMDKEDRLVGSSAYTGEFKTGHYDFRDFGEGIAEKNKLFDHLAVEFVPQGDWDLFVDVYIDGKFSETIDFPMTVTDDGLGSFTLDTDPLGREEAQTITKPLHGSGRRISFHARQSGSNQNFEVTSFTVGFRLSAEQATNI
jgi:hypothetical protein